MSDSFLRSLFKVVVTVAIAGIILNDVGQVVMTRWQTGEKANGVAQVAYETYARYKSVAVAENEARKAAVARNLELESIQVSEKEAVVQVKATTVNTLWAHYIKQLAPYLSTRVQATYKLF